MKRAILILYILLISSVAYNGNRNIVASRLSGTWILDEKLTTRLGGYTKNLEFTFKLNKTFLKKIPVKIMAKIKRKKLQIIAGGELVLISEKLSTELKAVFFITLFRSNTIMAVVFKRNNRFKVESLLISLAVAKYKHNDILFVGGDMPNEAFSAFKRKNLRNK